MMIKCADQMVKHMKVVAIYLVVRQKRRMANAAHQNVFAQINEALFVVQMDKPMVIIVR